MAQCKDCGSAFAFHELREERCLSCWHRLSTGNPLPPDAKRELAHKIAMLEEELERVKAQAAIKTNVLRDVRSWFAGMGWNENGDHWQIIKGINHALAADAGKEQR